jgi:hypothetical protein
MGGATHALLAYRLLLCEDAKCADGYQSMSPAFEIIANVGCGRTFFIIFSSFRHLTPERSP